MKTINFLTALQNMSGSLADRQSLFDFFKENDEALQCFCDYLLEDKDTLQHIKELLK